MENQERKLLMNDELTAVDIRKMQEELEYRRIELRPKLIEDVKTAREFGDLSENFEYKSAKREKNRNDSRIRYLERMIKTAKVIDVRSKRGRDRPVRQGDDLYRGGRRRADHRAGHHPPAKRPQGPHQQGIPGWQGRARP